jgi:hypothetical protein
MNRSYESLNSLLFCEAVNSPKALLKCRLAPLPLEKVVTSVSSNRRESESNLRKLQQQNNHHRLIREKAKPSSAASTSSGGTASASTSASSSATSKTRGGGDNNNFAITASIITTTDTESTSSHTITPLSYNLDPTTTISTAASAMTTTTTTTTMTTKEDQMLLKWQTLVEPNLLKLDRCYKESLYDEFSLVCSKLNKILDVNEMYTKQFSKRSALLTTIFKYLDTDNNKVRVSLAKIILNVSKDHLKFAYAIIHLFIKTVFFFLNR